VAIVEALTGEIDAGVAARAAAATAGGHTIACREGCNACCCVVVMVYRPEAVTIARWLARPENAPARAAFLDEYARWRAALADGPERLTSLFVRGHAQPYDALHDRLWRKQVMCAFNRDGRCVIYPVRPLGCRNMHALESSDRCAPDNPTGRPPEALDFVPLRELLESATRLVRATHNALTSERHAQAPVCSAVHALLAR
jgi:hypothetical protein